MFNVFQYYEANIYNVNTMPLLLNLTITNAVEVLSDMEIEAAEKTITYL
jgi:hypothetical protein